jgi:hypothetical protein
MPNAVTDVSQQVEIRSGGRPDRAWRSGDDFVAPIG